MSQNNKPQVLVVDDSQTIRNAISRYLGENYDTLHASNGDEAWQMVMSEPGIALIFADLHMPVMNGMTLLKLVRGSKVAKISNLPVIMITGHEDSDAAKRASYTMGASDFISKPFTELDIVSRVSAYTSLTRKIATLEQSVIHDSLTGMYNDKGFAQVGEQALAGAKRHDYFLSVLQMQVTNLVEIHGKYGGKIVAQIINAIACSMKKSLRKEETLAHLGKGQFAMLLPMTKAARARIVAHRFQQTVKKLVFKIGQESIRVDLALGINSTEEDFTLQFSEFAMHAEQALHTSLKSKTLSLSYYQPELDSKDEISQSDICVTTTPEESAQREFQMLNTAAFSRYMSMILNGEFERIPKDDIPALVKPIESFLQYVSVEAAVESN